MSLCEDTKIGRPFAIQYATKTIYRQNMQFSMGNCYTEFVQWLQTPESIYLWCDKSLGEDESKLAGWLWHIM